MQKLTRGKVSLVGAGIVIALLALLLASNVFTTGRGGVHAAPSSKQPSLFALEHQHGKASISASPASKTFAFNCAALGGSRGNLVVNVTELVANDADSGQAGDYWALDTFTRTIKIYNVGDNSWCVAISYTNATFAAFAGQQSPGSTASSGGILTGDEVGSFFGSAQFSITGDFDVSDPGRWPTTGLINSGSVVDYQCDSSGNCPGYVDWTTKYFTNNPTVTEPQWGWKYTGHDSPNAPDHGTPDGVWVNALSGNSGDILDVD